MIFRSPEPALDLPEVPLTPFLLERAEARPDKPAFIDGASGRALTYQQWADRVRRAAAALAARGLRKGDVAAIYSPNLPEYPIVFHAVSLIGGVITTVSPLYTARELSAQLRDAGARFLFTVPPCVATAHEATQGTRVEEVFVFGEAQSATPFATLLNGDGIPPTPAIEPRHDVIVLPYSSGTTGLPKGVMLTHYNLVSNILQMNSVLGIDETDTVLGMLPFFHIYGMVVIMNLALYSGATVVTMARFELEPFLETLQKYRVTFAPVVPPVVLALAKHPLVENYKLSNLRVLFSGAAPLRANVAEAAATRLGCSVHQGYGLTETSPGTHGTRVAESGRKLASVGPPVQNTEVRVVNVETRVDCGPNEEGEIWVRGPQVMRGYLNHPEATATTIDQDGWLHTGDIGYADEDGSFFIVDRLKELIKYKGMQIAPAELEAILLGHPGIADAAVIPLADEEAGEVPKAFVVTRGEITAADVMAYVAARVAPYKKLRAVEMIDQIPKSPSGKILRRVLVQREAAAAGS